MAPESPGEFQAVTGPVDGLDVGGFTGVGLQLGAQMADMDADRLNVVVRVVSPHVLENQGGGHRLAVTLQEAVEQFKLQVREAHGLFKPEGLEPFRDQGEGTETQDFRTPGGQWGSGRYAATTP